jgi:anti-sigma B factor antagonist
MDESLEVVVKKSGDVTVVHFAGEVDVASAPELRGRLEELAPADTKVIVDLSDVRFLDSTGLGVLVAGWKRFQNREGTSRLSLVVTRPEILRVLEVTGLTDVFTVHPSVAEATALSS